MVQKSKIKMIVKNVVNEANGFEDDEMFPDEIRQFMSDEEKEEFLDDEPLAPGQSGSYTLDDLVDTQVLKTRTPAGTKGWVDNTLRTLRDLMTNDELSEKLMDIKESQKTFDEFSETRDRALEIWTQSASKVLGTDASKLPELSDNMFLNGFLYDFWFMSTYIKPLERQADKGKDLTASLKSVNERWKYMTTVPRVKDFIKKVITPVFVYLTRDTDVAG